MKSHGLLFFLLSLMIVGCTKNGDLTQMPGGTKNSATAVTTPAPGTAQLAWSETDLLIANTLIGNEKQQTSTLTNQGTKNSAAISFTWMGSESSIAMVAGLDNCSGKTLSPQESCTVTFKFLPSSEGVKHRSVQIFGQIANSLTVWGSTDPEDPDLAEFSIDHQNYDFGDVLVGSSVDLTEMIINQGSIDLINGTVQVTDANNFYSLTNNCPTVLGVTQNCSVVIHYQPTQAGTHVATVEVKYSGKSKLITLTARALTPSSGTPVAYEISAATNEDSSLNSSVNAFDPGGLNLTYNLVSPAVHGQLNLNNDGTFVYQPAENYNGTDTAVFKVTNTNNQVSNLALINLTINPVNDIPVVVNQLITTNKNQSVDFILQASDIESSLSYTITGNPLHGTITGTPPNLTYIPSFGYVGGDVLTFTVNDGQVDSSTGVITFNVAFVEVAPVTENLSLSTNEENPLMDTLMASDTNGDTLSFVVAAQPTHGTVSVDANTGDFTYTPEVNFFGSDFFAYRAFDGTLYSNLSVVTITVLNINDLPTALAQTVNVNEDQSVGITLTGSDVDGDALTYTVLNGPSNGVLTGSVPNLTYTPNNNFSGADSFTFKANDGVGDSGSETINIVVNNINDAPIAETQSLNTNEDEALPITLTGTDVENASLSYTVVSGPTHGVLSGSGASVTYTPNLNYYGGDSFSFKVNDGQLDSNIAVISLTVNSVNDLPTAQDNNFSVSEDNILNNSVLGLDVEGDTLTYIVVSNPSHGLLSLNNNGNFTYTPTTNYHGTDSFTFKVNDGLGDSNTATVTLTITPVNDIPVANDLSFSLNEDTSYNGTLTASDIDLDILTYTLVANAQKGEVIVNNDGTFSYTPRANEVGSDSFTFLVNDSQENSSAATVNITINPLNDAPQTNNAGYSTEQNTAVSMVLDGQDVDGDTLTYAITESPTLGTLSGTAPNLTYTPNNSVTGTDSFKYKVNDGQVDSNESTITISILDNGNWHLVGWNNRRKILFNNTNGTTLTNIPVVIKFDNTEVDYTHMKTNGEDLRFVDAQGNSLPYTIENFNATGESVVWVNVPTIGAGSTADFIWMYYNNPAANASEDAGGVNGGSVSSWELDEGNNLQTDYSGNNLNLTPQGTLQSITGKNYQGIKLTSNSDYLYHNDDALFNPVNFSIEAWVKEETRGTNSIIVQKNGQYGLYINNGRPKIEAAGTSIEVDAGNEISLNEWHHLLVVFNDNANQCLIFIDGQLVKSATCNNSLSATASLFLVGGNGSSNGFKGAIDNLKYFNSALDVGYATSQKLAGEKGFAVLGSENIYGQAIIYSQLLAIKSTVDDGQVNEWGSKINNNTTIEQGNGQACVLVICDDKSEWGYYRMQINQAISVGANIIKSQLRLYSKTQQSWTTGNSLQVYLQNTASATQVTSNNNCPDCSTAIPVVNTSVNWNSGGLTWNLNQYQYSPNLAPLINTLINNQNGITGGSYVQLWLTRHSNYGLSTQVVGAEDYSDNGLNQAQLLIEWQE